MKKIKLLSKLLAMMVFVSVLMGCATAKLNSGDLAKVNSGQLIRVETENQETIVNIAVGEAVSEAVGKMHDLRIRVKAVDGTNVYRKLGDASQVFALSPGLHNFDFECTYNITKDKKTEKFSRLGAVEIDLKGGHWYQLRNRASRDVCKFEIREVRL